MQLNSIDVIQLGARENYAVPRMLHSRNLLRCLYTDLYFGSTDLLGRVESLLPQMSRIPSIMTAVARRSSDLPAS